MGSHPPPVQVVGFVVLLSGTSVYNEILRSCLPTPAEPHRRSSRRHSRPGTANTEVGSLQEPLLLGEADFEAAAGAQQQQQQQGKRGSNVRFADMPPSQPIAAGRQSGGEHGRYTMARWAGRRVGRQACLVRALAWPPGASVWQHCFT